MTIESLNKRLTRLGDSASPMASLADSLDAGRARHKARQDEWQAAGKTGRVPPEPLKSHRRARPRAGWTVRRGARLPRAAPASSSCRSWKFDEQRAASTLVSDEDLW